MRVHLTQADRDALCARLQSPGLSVRTRKRIQVVLASARGAAPHEIALQCQMDVQTVRRYLRAYHAGGVEALTRRPLRLTQRDHDVLCARLHAPGLSRRLRQRIQMVVAAADGATVSEIAVQCRVDVQTVRKYLRAYRLGGVEALADRPRSGRPGALSDADWAALRALLDGGACEGWPCTLRQLAAWLASERGVHIRHDRLCKVLRERGLPWKSAKRALRHQAAVVQQAETIAEHVSRQAPELSVRA
jgi:transposase